RREVVVGVIELDGLELLLRGMLDRDLALELGADDLDLFVGQRLRRRPHLTEAHEDLDQLGHRDAERLRQVLDGDARLDGDRPRWRRRRGLARLGRRVRAIARLAPSAAPATALDDDPALASARPSARTDRPVWSLSSVSHVSSV